MQEHLREEMVRLEAELASLQDRISRLQRRFNQLLAQAATPPPVSAPPPAIPAPPPAPPAPPIPAAPLRSPAPPTQPAAEPKRRPSLEQRVGVSWLSKIGMVVFILGAIFFFQYAVQQGWIGKPVRVMLGILAGLALLGVGEWTLRKDWRMWAAAVTGGGIALLYLSAYAASPKLYELISTKWAFGLMCAVTVLAVGLSLRSGMVATVILAQIGAYLTPLLLSTGKNEQVVLMSYLLAVAVGFVLTAAVRRWNSPAPVALAGTAIVFLLWAANYVDQSPVATTSGFAWALFAIFAIYAAVATATKRAHNSVGIAVLAACGVLLGMLWFRMIDPLWRLGFFVHLLVLDALVLWLCLWRRWHWLRAGALALTAFLILLTWVARSLSSEPAITGEYLSGWIWAFYGLFLADVLIRAWWRGRRTNEPLDAGLATAATAMMFTATYLLLPDKYADWMGAYTAGLAVAAIALAWLLRRWAKRRILGYAFLGQGLVLLTLAMPIQFDKSSLTIAWSAQAVVSMLLATRLRSTLLLAKAPILLLLAAVHFASVDVPHDTALAEIMLTVGGIEIRYMLVLGVGLTVAAMLSAALLLAGAAIHSDKGERALTGGLIIGGAIVWGWITCLELPAQSATWWWLALAGGVAAAGLCRRKLWLAGIGGVMLAAAAGKFLAFDTLYRRLEWGLEGAIRVVLNWQVAMGVALAAMAVMYGRLLRRRLAGSRGAGGVATTAALLGAIVVLWAGSFEVDRYFSWARAGIFADLDQAEQMGHSMWWALYAALLLAIGFISRRPAIRYMALGLFAVTLAKVLLVDMAGIDLVYRIGSFLALGVLLVAASLLYQRFFQSALANWDKPREQ